MDRFRFFQGFVILLAATLLFAGGSLLRESVSRPSKEPWDLLGGALLCSLALTLVYFLCRRQPERR
jgi:drug/metabolite transporter (DMT)-like permease